MRYIDLPGSTCNACYYLDNNWYTNYFNISVCSILRSIAILVSLRKWCREKVHGQIYITKLLLTIANTKSFPKNNDFITMARHLRVKS